MKLPLVPTALVALAMATMVGLGIWQLDRRGEKEALLAQYRSAAELPPIAFPEPPSSELAFRRATGFCLEPVGWRTVAWQSRSGEPGWGHIAACRTGGGEGPGMQVLAGWSRDVEPPRDWAGGEVGGMLAPDPEHVLLLVADEPAPGLEAAALPTTESIPNNHLLYAIQWFAFAAIAGAIYFLALRRRRREAPELRG